MSGQRDELAYLTIVAEPRDMAWERFLDLVSRATGLDALTVQQRLAKKPPQILCRAEASRAAALAGGLRSRGVDAISVTAASLAALGAPMLVKFMQAESEGYRIDIWRGPSTFLPTAAMQAIIRASVRTTSSRPQSPPPSSGSELAGPGMSPYTLHSAIEQGRQEEYSRLRRAASEARSSDLIDVHTGTGLWFRISGDKFAWHVLGSERGMSDRVNADRLAQRLAAEAPQAIFDEFYQLFKPPPGAFVKGQDAAAFGVKHAEGLGMFDFYSRWACLVYRHIAGAG